MSDLLNGVIKRMEKEETIDLGSAADQKFFDFPNFNVNYVELTLVSQNATDAATIAEKLAKLGTIDITTTTKKGQWGTAIDADDLYYRQAAKLNNSESLFLIGEAGATDDAWSRLKLILDSGLGRKINSKCGWSPDMKARLKVSVIADAGLDNCKLYVKYVGYEGIRPQKCLAVNNQNKTFATATDYIDYITNDGDILHEAFAYLTSEYNLATITTFDLYGLRTLEHRKGKDSIVTFYPHDLIDGITESGIAGLQEYARKSWDSENQGGLGYTMNGSDNIIRFNAGVAEAIRTYLSVLETI